MADTVVYGPQYFNLSDGTISDDGVGSAYWSSAFGGTGTPVAGFPEIASMENIKNVAALAGGAHDGLDEFKVTDNYWQTGMQLLKVVAAPKGNAGIAVGSNEFDIRPQGVKKFRASTYSWLKTGLFNSSPGFFPLTVVAEAGGGQAQVNSGWVVQAEFQHSSGSDFQWNLAYYHPSGVSFLRVDINGSLTLAPDTLDNLLHKVEIEIVPATVTGAFNGSGGPGSASVAMDGSTRLFIDGVQILSATNIDLVVNRYATTNPRVYYGYGFWYGDAAFGGGADSPPQTGLYAAYVDTVLTPTTRPTPVINTPVPDACCSATPGTTAAGPVNPSVLPDWSPVCGGGGTVPTQADLADVESWV